MLISRSSRLTTTSVRTLTPAKSAAGLALSRPHQLLPASPLVHTSGDASLAHWFTLESSCKVSARSPEMYRNVVFPNVRTR